MSAVGFIGLGDQGAPMARAVGGGYDLHVWARRPESLRALDTTEFTVAESVATLAGAVDVLLLCLRDDDDILDLLEHHRLLDGLRPGSVVANHGTGDPGVNEMIARRFAAHGVAYLDAPVSGGGPGARARTLTTFVGGDRAAYERCEPIFATFSRTVVHMGAVGTGQLTKLLNNSMTMSNLKNAADMLRVAEQLGVDISALVQAISVSSGASFVLGALNTEITPDVAPHLQSLMRKDIEHFADAVRARGADPGELRERGLAGADGLVEAVAIVAGRPAAAR
ncbi:NAD(P)-dependent oxidoreductase [Micromonospora chokoriensis]|uniref:3-hydroxyisobutyrate dehydrogenase n=1 Tax=Micromonospora chokoriensis TaxID=356851 RepID=A0A1C4UR48_9ACTN|nr:NAD(P)-dependent oxidoreductase [Micromonospora chokoriensis]SCE74125.1 3-hydroxyisobutyrate dehydrogenase [Micromonospora chokoriensis]